MSSLASEFSEMIRNPHSEPVKEPAPPTPEPAEGTCWAWCPPCGERTDHQLAYHTEMETFYRCPVCRNVQAFRVR